MIFCSVLSRPVSQRKKIQFEDRDIFGGHYTVHVWGYVYILKPNVPNSIQTNLFEARYTCRRPALPIWGQLHLFEASFTYLGQPCLFEASFTYLRPALSIWGQPYLFEASFTYLRPALPIWGQPYCAAGFALLNLPKGKSLGRSIPETNSYAQALATHCVGFLLYPSSAELPYAK